MDNVRISEQAKIQAQRILSGQNVSDEEVRSVLASLLISVCEIKSMVENMRKSLWSEDTVKVKMREFCKECKGKGGGMSPRQEVVVRVAPWAAAVVVVVAVCYAVVSHSLVRAGHGERVADNLKEAVQAVK